MPQNLAKPCSRVMRASSYQTDQNQKEPNCCMPDEEHTTMKDPQIRVQPIQEISFCKNVDVIGSSLLSDKSAHPPPYREDLPTFVVHQDSALLQLWRKCESKSGQNASSWLRVPEQQCTNAEQHQRFHPLVTKDCSSPHASWPAIKVSRFANIVRLFGKDSKYSMGEQSLRSEQKTTVQEENSHACSHSFTLACQKATVTEELGVQKRRNSSASADEVVNFREAVSKEMPCDVKRPFSWEEEVRQAMANSLLISNRGDEALGLQRSSSIKSHTSSVVPCTYLAKDSGRIRSGNVSTSETKSRWNKAPLMQMKAMGKDMGTGINVKSPREEGWQEAADVEEESQRMQRSLSMRHHVLQAGEARCVSRKWQSCRSKNASDKDHGWAVYNKTGYVNVEPHAEGSFGVPACCNFMLKRSFSTHDTGMGLVMECANCGTVLGDADSQLLCFCSSCAANQGCPSQGGIATYIQKKGAILRACRKLLRLGKKQPLNSRAFGHFA